MTVLKRKQELKNTSQQLQKYADGNIFSFILIALAVFAVYSATLNYPFQFDDESSIVYNNDITTLTSFNNIHYWLSAYRPLAAFSFALNFYFGGLDVSGYHIVNLFIHIISGFFVYFLIRLLLNLNNYRNHKTDRYNNWIALFSALIFVIHPIQTQAITYIVQRMASMAAMFYIVSVYLYAAGRIEHVQNSNISRAVLFYLSALICGLLGVMTKQSAATFPFAFLLFEICFVRDRENNIFKKYIIASSAVLIVINALFLYYNRQPLSYALHGADISSMDYLINQFVVIIKYLRMVLLPINQCADYGSISDGYDLVKTFWMFDVIGSLLLLILLFASAVFLFKKNKAVSFGIFWFFLALSVESSIIPIADPMFEHRMYLPMAGISLTIVAGIFMLMNKSKAVYVFLALSILILFWGILCYSRNEVWKDKLTLWTDVVNKAPNNARAWYNMGILIKDLRRYDEALIYFDNAIELKPDYSDALLNKGMVYASLGKIDEVIKCYNRVIELNPDDYQSWNNIGNALEKIGRYGEAIDRYKKAAEIKPDFELAWYNAGVASARSGNQEKAVEFYNKALEIKPDFDLAWHNKGDALSSLGKYQEAVKCYDEAIKIIPDSYKVWNNKGTALKNIGQYKEAIESYDKALAIEPNFGMAWFNKGVTLSIIDLNEEAIKCYDKMIEINPAVYEAWNNKGTVLEKLGRYEEAIKCYDKALEINPSFSTAQSNKFLTRQKNRIKKIKSKESSVKSSK
ncbi:MAG: tetratricopeptide repeat protein [Bacteroidetes bacterium]|nr:tetratricopeptide repeat protein [Bacteroidota bacterium]